MQKFKLLTNNNVLSLEVLSSGNISPSSKSVTDFWEQTKSWPYCSAGQGFPFWWYATFMMMERVKNMHEGFHKSQKHFTWFKLFLSYWWVLGPQASEDHSAITSLQAVFFFIDSPRTFKKWDILFLCTCLPSFMHLSVLLPFALINAHMEENYMCHIWNKCGMVVFCVNCISPT